MQTIANTIGYKYQKVLDICGSFMVCAHIKHLTSERRLVALPLVYYGGNYLTGVVIVADGGGCRHGRRQAEVRLVVHREQLERLGPADVCDCE